MSAFDNNHQLCWCYVFLIYSSETCQHKDVNGRVPSLKVPGTEDVIVACDNSLNLG